MAPKTAPVTMYDAVTSTNIPTSAQVVAGYIDGDYAWTEEDWRRFPDAEKVLITVNGDLKGNVCDIENGDMTPADALRWIQAKQGKGIGGCTVYCSKANLPSVWSACRGHAYYVWVADWTNSAHAVKHTVATQYSNVDNAYDISEVYSQEWLDVLFRVNRPWPV